MNWWPPGITPWLLVESSTVKVALKVVRKGHRLNECKASLILLFLGLYNIVFCLASADHANISSRKALSSAEMHRKTQRLPASSESIRQNMYSRPFQQATLWLAARIVRRKVNGELPRPNIFTQANSNNHWIPYKFHCEILPSPVRAPKHTRCLVLNSINHAWRHQLSFFVKRSWVHIWLTYTIRLGETRNHSMSISSEFCLNTQANIVEKQNSTNQHVGACIWLLRMGKQEEHSHFWTLLMLRQTHVYACLVLEGPPLLSRDPCRQIRVGRTPVQTCLRTYEWNNRLWF